MKYLPVVVCSTLLFFSCCTEVKVQEVFGLGTETPVFLGCKSPDSGTVRFEFSHPVKVASLQFSNGVVPARIEEGHVVTAFMDKGFEPGVELSADLLVRDHKGNSLNVLTAFRAKNDNLPLLKITEVRNRHDVNNKSVMRSEFVEFYVEKEGNLGALKLCIASPAKTGSLVYEFPVVKVKKGEYIVLHLQDKLNIGVDETGDNLGLSPLSGVNDKQEKILTEANHQARDFWFKSSKKTMTYYFSDKKEGAVYFLDQDDNVLDALLFAPGPTSGDWSHERTGSAAALLAGKGAWKSGIVQDAFAAANTAPTRTICRRTNSQGLYSDTNSADDWYVGGHSPGRPNTAAKE